ENWQAVEISCSGWRILPNPPVRFRRPKGMQAIVAPEPGGSDSLLWRFVNLGDARDRILVSTWASCCLRPRGPYPILILNGEQGSAKSTSAKVLRALIDPNDAPLRSEPREPRDLMIAATNGRLVAFDNLSHLPPWLSDALCRLATGGGFATRELYTNDEETIFDAMRPVVLTGIEELATRADLLHRCPAFRLPPLSPQPSRPHALLSPDS